MCGIFAILAAVPASPFSALACNAARGRDAWGIWAPEFEQRLVGPFPGFKADLSMVETVALGNLRAEPTTEHVKSMGVNDIQPYQVGDWVIVHNGTIANDKELCDEFGLTPTTRIDSWVIAALLNKDHRVEDRDEVVFELVIRKLVGSYAICAVNVNRPNVVHFAMNYRPLYLNRNDPNVVVLSSVPLALNDRLLPPYSIGSYELVGDEFVETIDTLYTKPKYDAQKVLVVYSGGLDSTVAAAELKQRGYDITLLHFDYGARATSPERQAVEAVAKRMNVPLEVITTPIFKDVIGGSRLTNTKQDSFAEGEAGAEYAHEWVPARNLILLSIALGIAEARGFDFLALGANLEEAGAYPDNEPEFLRQFNKLIPFAVGDGKNIQVLTPVGNMMKHEIVKLGLQIGAPMELSWSCYDAVEVRVARKQCTPGLDGKPIVFTTIGDYETQYKHCGKCGPCFMRRTAFEINGEVDPVFAAIECV